MDIYSYLSSPDVAAYCREIGKTWNTYEMAVIIRNSSYPQAEQHAAWQELIEHYPDMSVTLYDHSHHETNIESVHKLLTEYIEYDKRSQEQPDIPEPLDDFCWNICYVRIPVPFKRGDILVISHIDEKKQDEHCFVLDKFDQDNEERILKWINNTNYLSEAWGLFVDKVGVLYGNHVISYERCVYYRGKLKGKSRLLHYVSLFIQGEIGLPELLTMQCRLIAEHLLTNNFLIASHGCYIPEYLLAENRLTPDEKKKIEESNGLMPWVEGKLTIQQVEFLAEIMGCDTKTMQLVLGKPAKWYLGRCAGIVHDENHYEKTKDNRFNPDRRNMAKSFLEVYGHTEAGWVDKHASSGTDGDGCGIPMPDYSLLDASDE